MFQCSYVFHFLSDYSIIQLPFRKLPNTIQLFMLRPEKYVAHNSCPLSIYCVHFYLCKSENLEIWTIQYKIKLYFLHLNTYIYTKRRLDSTAQKNQLEICVPFCLLIASSSNMKNEKFGLFNTKINFIFFTWTYRFALTDT